MSEKPKRRIEDPIKTSPGQKSLNAELYRLGRIRRHLQPPGGLENGIFDAFKLPPENCSPRRKATDYLKSNVFDEMEVSPRRPPVTPAHETTHHHLFAPSVPKSQDRHHNRMKSSVFDPDPEVEPPPEKSKKNPVTGDFCEILDGAARLGKSRSIRNPITFEGMADRAIPSRCTQPPGGKCSLVLEYVE